MTPRIPLRNEGVGKAPEACYHASMSNRTLTADVQKRSRKIAIEVDADRFERLAAVFGMFNPDFLRSLARAENDYRTGKTRRLTSLKDIRRA